MVVEEKTKDEKQDNKVEEERASKKRLRVKKQTVCTVNEAPLGERREEVEEGERESEKRIERSDTLLCTGACCLLKG